MSEIAGLSPTFSFWLFVLIILKRYASEKLYNKTSCCGDIMDLNVLIMGKKTFHSDVIKT